MLPWELPVLALLSALAGIVEARSEVEVQQPPADVRHARDLIAARDPTRRLIAYEAEYELTWYSKLVYDQKEEPSTTPIRDSIPPSKGPVKFPRSVAIDPPVTSTGTLRVEQDGRRIRIVVTPRGTAPEHLHLHQLRQPITIWQNDQELGELRQLENLVIVDVGQSTKSPWPDQLIVPHVLFTSYLAPDWNQKFPRMFIWYDKLNEAFPITTNVSRKAEEIVVSESFTKPGVETRYGPYSQLRRTRYALVHGQLLPIEITRVHSGVEDIKAEIEWARDNVVDTSQPLMPSVIRFVKFAPPFDRTTPPMVSERQTFKITRYPVQVDGSRVGLVSIPDGFQVMKRYPKGDPREAEEFVASASVRAIDRGWLMVTGAVVVIVMIVAAFVTALRKSGSTGASK
jgi:hypothetical protein